VATTATLVRTAAPRPLYVGWLALFLTQSTLAATGRVAAHMRLGRLAIGVS
jgi:hypothetical protein